MISVIIPVYNVENYLNKCIDSVLRQTYTQYEVILVDDGSTDRSGEICDSFSSNESVKVIHQSNQGVSKARNEGLSSASGDYVLFVDADDWLAPEMLMRLISEIGDSDLAMCYNYVVIENENGEYEYKDIWNHDRQAPYKVQNVYYEILDKSATLWNKLIRRNIIGDQRFHTGMTYGEDSVFLAECLDTAKSAVVVPECLYYYNSERRGNVVSASIDSRSLEFLDNTKVIFDHCKAGGCPSVGIRRILASVAMVQSKIRLTVNDIIDKKQYSDACVSLLRYPDISDYLHFFADKKMPLYAKKDALIYQFGQLYL